MIRIVIVDDHPVVRKGIHSLLCEFPDVDVVGESDGGPGFLLLCEQTQPDIVLLDIKLQSGDGLGLCAALRRDYPLIRVIILTGFDDEAYLQKALRLGVRGYLLKSSSPEILMDTIRAVNSGERRITASLLSAVLRGIEQIDNGQDPTLGLLNEEESQVLQLLAGGASIADIATQLYISERTVKRKIHDLLEKLEATTHANAVAEGYKRGILS